jgi:hypothetical protein
LIHFREPSQVFIFLQSATGTLTDYNGSFYLLNQPLGSRQDHWGEHLVSGRPTFLESTSLDIPPQLLGVSVPSRNLAQAGIRFHSSVTLTVKKFMQISSSPTLSFLFKRMWCVCSCGQCCGSEIIFSGSGSYLDLNFGSGFGSGLFMKNTLEIQMI